jgi:hypothetical protein
MGKQVNFYMTNEDERDFLAFARSDRSIGVFMDIQKSKEICFLDEELPDRETPGWFALSLWDRHCSPPPVLRYIHAQDHFAVDRIESEVIEFDRSTFDEGLLVRGRIWAEMSFWTEGVLVRKRKSFQKWFDRLASWIKRHAVRDEAGDYVLPGAAEYQKQGGKLVQVVFADSVKHVHHDL